MGRNSAKIERNSAKFAGGFSIGCGDWMDSFRNRGIETWDVMGLMGLWKFHSHFGLGFGEYGRVCRASFLEPGAGLTWERRPIMGFGSPESRRARGPGLAWDPWSRGPVEVPGPRVGLVPGSYPGGMLGYGAGGRGDGENIGDRTC